VSGPVLRDDAIEQRLRAHAQELGLNERIFLFEALQ